MKELARQWLAYADTDRRTCEQLIGSVGLEAVVAFHAQQTIEKTLKAIILYKDQTPPRVHDLVRLAAIVGTFDQIPITDTDVFDRINQYYTLSRYPQTIELAGPPAPTNDEVVEMLEVATRIFRNAKSIIG